MHQISMKYYSLLLPIALVWNTIWQRWSSCTVGTGTNLFTIKQRWRGKLTRMCVALSLLSLQNDANHNKH